METSENGFTVYHKNCATKIREIQRNLKFVSTHHKVSKAFGEGSTYEKKRKHISMAHRILTKNMIR